MGDNDMSDKHYQGILCYIRLYKTQIEIIVKKGTIQN